MSVRDFRGFPSIQEVQCWGGDLEPEVDLLSLSLYKVRDGELIAVVNPLKNLCLTFETFSSCFIDSKNARQSLVRTLVSHLDEGESEDYGCNATSFRTAGSTAVRSWSVVVTRKSKLAAALHAPPDTNRFLAKLSSEHLNRLKMELVCSVLKSELFKCSQSCHKMPSAVTKCPPLNT